MYKILISPILFLFDAERIHYFVVEVLHVAFKIPFVPQLLRWLYTFEHPDLVTEVAGLRFRNPVGLAAGFDKNAEMVDQLEALGFGYIEIGTVTPRPQPGNDKPRLFRLKKDKALINRMGFNNKGAAVASAKLATRKSRIMVGGNIGKNKDTPNEEALKDYLICFRELFDVVDYFVVNVSSPNTPGLRDLQEKGPLTALLKELQTKNREKFHPKPIFLKIAPDLTNSQLDDIIDIVKETGIAGVIATNTTIERKNLRTDKSEVEKIGAGGLSGAPLTHRSTEVIRYLCDKSNHAFPVIGVGGIASPGEALEKTNAGAALIQLYTGFIYEGPGLVKRICKAMVRQ
ncbi:Dihydroorotate dehydrogenase (quinone) [Dyadobacter sp. CECT 9623]|uniref:Dihydroorotate dehydrogenase (quinone) n=1 Tax=Dyadobacter linearis TaxID=2823330 RepID=A0ABN7R8F4_9BACT|nr:MULTISPECIES: quinone-dependent dihydroorotate dehydrogenase [unclassified Dyadobacter]MCE7058507.1 quinone-dependent dihydroorotate dehydrogenase [Dyadobacter sp. CY343]CAG5070500.1 Dihydroorotate dehydrogenase (quinone) [Dyadobacter sp. CECT 9623]